MTFQNSVVYTGSEGLGIDHKFGTSTASNIFFKNVNIEALQVNSGGQAAWLALFVEIAGEGVGPLRTFLLEISGFVSKGHVMALYKDSTCLLWLVK